MPETSGVATGGREGARAPSTPPRTTPEIHANPMSLFGGGGGGVGVVVVVSC